MLSTFPTLQYLLIAFAGWVHRQQLDVIDYLQEENRVLRELLGDKRLRFTDAQRGRLAEKAKRLGRKVLNDIASRDARYVDGLAPQADCDEVESFRQTRARASAHYALCQTSPRSSFVWPARIVLGAIRGSSRARQPRPPRGPRHGLEHPESARD